MVPISKYIATTDGNWSTVGTWSTGTNTPTTHASTTLTITTNYTAKFTAPSTSDSCLGAIFNISTVPTATYSYTVTLQENEVDTAATVTISGADLSSYGMFFAKFASAYTFTSTTASYYRFKIVASGSGATALKVRADSGGSLVAFQAVDSRHPAAAPTTGDDVWIIGGNQTGTVSVTMDGTQFVGSGAEITGSVVSFLQAVYVGTGGLLKWNTAASATLTCKGYITVNGIATNPGEFRIGTSDTPYPAAYTAQLIFDNQGTSGKSGMYQGGYGSSNYGKVQLHGTPRPDTTKWKTMLSSGTGTVADPIVLADAVGWATGDEVIVTTTSACPHSYRADENELATITRVDDSTYSLVGNLDPVNGDFEASDWAGWTKGGTYAIETSSVHSGAKAAKITYAGGGSYISQDFFIKAGAVCTLKFWTRGDGTNQGRYQIYRVNSTAADIVAMKNTGVTSTSWTEVTETFTAPAGCYQVRVYFHQPVAAGDAYFDDVTLTYAGLQYTHTANKAWVLNVTRNVVVKSIGNVEGWGGQAGSYSPFLGLTTTTLDFDWVRFNNLRGPICGNYAAAGVSYHSVDYCVFMVPVSNNSSGIMGWTRHNSYGVEKPETLTGNIAYKGSATTAVYNMSAFNKNLVDCFAIQVNGIACSSFRSAGECTMTRCISLSQYTSDISGGFHLSGTGIKCIDCEVQSIFKQSIYVESPSVAIFVRQLHGTKASMNTVYAGDILSPSYSDLTFRDCTFQYPFPQGGNNTLSGSTPSSVWKVQNSGGLGTNVDFVVKQMGYLYRTGASLTDTTVHTPGGYALRFQPITSTTPLPWTYTISTGNIQTYEATVSIWVKINNAAYYAGVHQNPKLTINYDDGTLVTTTATDTTDWQKLTKSFTPTTTFGQVTVTIDGYTDATSTNAYFYVDDMELAYPSGYAVNLGKLDVWADGSPITPSSDTTGYLSYDWTQDPYVIHTESQANALTGIALNYTLKTLTVTEDHTITELYEYCKASARTNGVVQAFSTKDGITYTLAGGWTLVLGANVDISGTPFLNLNTTTLEFPITCSMEPILINGTLALDTAGTVECNMNGISIDYQGAGTFDHSGSTTNGTITLDTSTSSTVTAKFAPGTTVDNQDEVHITVESSTSVNIVVTGLVVGSQVRVTETVSGDELINETATGTSVSTSYVYTTDVAITILVRKASAATKYLEWTGAGTITTAGANITVVQVADSNIEATTATATGWAVDYDTKVISATGTPDSLTTGELYTWLMDQMDSEANMVYLNPMTCEVKDSSYTLRNGYTLDTGVEQYLSDGGIATSDGDTIYTNIFTVGSLVASSQVYIKQNGAKITSWWSTGNIDVLIKVKSGGSLIDSGNLYFYVRKFGNTYEYTSLDASAGGRQVVAVSNASDSDNQTASGTVASWSDITITWGSTTKDIGDGEGAKPYDVVVDGAGRTVAQIYEYLKYVCRDGETTEQNGVDGELYLSAVPATYTLVKTGPFGSIAGGTLFLARGVYLEDMASADSLNYQVIDSDGGVHTPPTPPVYISLSNIVDGSRVQLYNTDTSTELYNDIVSGTTLSVEYTPAETEETIRVRATFVDGATTAYLFYEANLVAGTNGGSAVLAQVEDTVYEANGIDGSAITSCSVTGTTIKVFVDEADNTINIQDIYNWYCYMLFTESGIRDQGWNLRAVDSTNYVAYNTLLIHNDGGDPLLLGGGYILQNTGGTALDVYDTTGDPIFMGYNHAVGVGSGLSTEEHNKLESLQNPSLLIGKQVIV